MNPETNDGGVLGPAANDLLVDSSLEQIHDVDIRLESGKSQRSKTPKDGSPERKSRKKRSKKKDGFAATFGKIKALDPLAEENRKHIENMEKGFLELLELHNTMELSSLCGMLGIRIERKTKNVEKKALIMGHIKRLIDKDGKPDIVYIGVLKHMWEGTLFEYLRAKGQPLHSTEQDPRGFVIAFWRKMTKTIVPFDPYYVPKNLQNRAADERRAEDIVAILDTMEAKELAVKAAEHKIRREHDYTNVLTYLQSVTSLHNTEREGRNYLIGEVEIGRAKVAHAEESIGMLNTQLTELENRHEYVKENWVQNMAHNEFLGGDYFEQMVNGHADQEYNNNLIRRQLLDIRTKDNSEFPGEEPDDEQEDAKIARAKADATIRANSYEEISKINDTEQLIRRLGVRNRRERHALKMELKEALSRESNLKKNLDDTEMKLEDQTERADDAEDTLYALRAQNDQFKDRVAAREAVIETEAEEYFDLAAQSVEETSDLNKRIQNAMPILQNLLFNDNAEVARDVAKTLEALGVMTSEGVMEHLENISMLKEETKQRETEILAHVKRAKTPKKGTKGGATGKGTAGKKAAGSKKKAAKRK